MTYVEHMYMSLCHLVAITVLLYILTGLNLKKLFCDVWYAISHSYL